MSDDWKVSAHKDVIKKDKLLLEASDLDSDFDEVVAILKVNPFQRVRQMEKMNPKNKSIYSMRINSQHRVVYTVDKEKHTVKIWSAWSHYESRMPR